MSVAERGRLPAEVHAAYLAAHGGRAAPAKARRPTPTTKQGDFQQPGSTSAAEAAPPLTSATRPRKTSPAETAPDPRPTSHAEPAEPDGVAALVDELAALTARVAHLEQSASAVKPSRFRRRSS